MMDSDYEYFKEMKGGDDDLTTDQQIEVNNAANADKQQASAKISAKAQNTIAKSQKPSRQFLASLLVKSAGYIVLFIIILIIILAVNGAFSSGGLFSRKYDSTTSFFGKLWYYLTAPFAFISKKLGPYTTSVTLFPKEPVTIPREQLYSGRCDQIRWIQDNADGEKGFCYSSIRPNDIIWDLEKTKMPEYFNLPQIIRSQADYKMKVRIPYSQTPEDSFYVPRCDLATFAGTVDPNDPKKEISAAGLFEDTGTTCKLKEMPSKTYKAMQRKKDDNLDTLRELDTV